MSYLALYRKYRPKEFNEVVGQDKIVKVIRNAIIHDKISHAYLFSGPRGTGKTTTAKLIASMVNCLNPINGEPCGECDSCSKLSINNDDIIEIDAASNNGVDEIRELRDKVNLVPSKCKYKVYIIDEVHMLTTGAFNALLKTLEEPPRHVIFILATTEPYKVPLTISSRCQKFQFNKLSIDEIIKRLNIIIENEKASITYEAVYEIARMSDGAMRDAINLLDQLISYKNDKITLEDVHEINGTVSYVDMYNLLVNISKGDTEYIIDFLDRIDKEGKDIAKFSEELIIFIKDILITKNTNISNKIGDKEDKLKEIGNLYLDEILYEFILEMNETINNIKNASYPLILLQVMLLKIINKYFKEVDVSKKTEESKQVQVQSVDEKKENNIEVENIEVKSSKEFKEDIIKEKVVQTETINIGKEDENFLEIKKIRINNAFATASKEKLNEIKNKWHNISEYLIDKKYGIIAGMLNDVDVIVAGENNLILLAKYDSSSLLLNDKMEEIKKLLNKIFDTSYDVIAICNNEWEEYRKEFINKTKNGFKYELIPEKVSIKPKKNKKKNEDLEQLIESFGSDIIDYR